MSDFIKEFQNRSKEIDSIFEQQRQNDLPIAVNIDDSINDIYRNQKDFNPYGHNPLDPTNYDTWLQKETMGTALSKGFNSFGHQFGNTFVDYWKDYGRMADALFSWDWNKMMPSEAQMLEQSFQDKLNSNKNFVFAEPGTEDDIFTKKTLSEFIGNAGFMAGTTAGMFIELGADAIITALSGGTGAASIGATIGRYTAKITGKTAAKKALQEGAEELIEKGIKEAAKHTNFIDDFARGFSQTANQSTDAIRNAEATHRLATSAAEVRAFVKGSKDSAMRGAINEMGERMSMNMGNILTSKSFSEVMMNMGKGIPLVGNVFRYGEKIAVGSKVGMKNAELVGIGFQGLRRTLMELNMAGTEASMEAIGTYAEMVEQQIKEKQIENGGQALFMHELDEIKSLSSQAAFGNYNTNLAILLASNQIMFGNVFNRFMPATKWISDITREGASRAFVVGSAKTGYKQYIKDRVLGVLKTLPDIQKQFGYKAAFGEFGKSVIRTVGKFEAIEGLQEMGQEASNIAWMNYYMNRHKEAEYTLMEAFGEGLQDQWSKQGLKVFLMGAFTGTMMRLPMHVSSLAVEQIQRASAKAGTKKGEKDYFTQADEQLQADTNLINKFFEEAKNNQIIDVSFVQQNVSALAGQMQGAMETTEGALLNSEYVLQNGKDSTLLETVLAATRTNTVEYLINNIKDVGQNMTAEEFLKTYTIDIKDTKYKTVKEFADKVASDIKKYADVTDKVRSRVKKYIDPLIYKKGKQPYYISAIMRATQEDVIRIVAYNQIKGQMTQERMKKIFADFSSIEGISSSSEYAMRILTNPNLMTAEIGSIKQEVLMLAKQLKEDTISKEDKAKLSEQKINKEAELDMLENWMKLYEERIEETKEGRIKTEQYTFKGIFKGKDKYEVENEDGTKGVKEFDVYDTKDDIIAELFTNIMNLKNKQLGISTQVNTEDVRAGLNYIVDYIALDNDTRDYQKAIDHLYNPEKMRDLMVAMQDGNMKHRMIFEIDRINLMLEWFAMSLIEQGKVKEAASIMTEFDKEMKESEEYKNFLAHMTNPEMGLDNYAFLEAEQKKLIIKKQELFNKYEKLYLSKEALEKEEIEEADVVDEEESTTEEVVNKVNFNTVISINDEHEGAYEEVEPIKTIKNVEDVTEKDIAKLKKINKTINTKKKRLEKKGKTEQEVKDIIEEEFGSDITFVSELVSNMKVSKGVVTKAQVKLKTIPLAKIESIINDYYNPKENTPPATQQSEIEGAELGQIETALSANAIAKLKRLGFESVIDKMSKEDIEIAKTFNSKEEAQEMLDKYIPKPKPKEYTEKLSVEEIDAKAFDNALNEVLNESGIDDAEVINDLIKIFTNLKKDNFADNSRHYQMMDMSGYTEYKALSKKLQTLYEAKLAQYTAEQERQEEDKVEEEAVDYGIDKNYFQAKKNPVGEGFIIIANKPGEENTPVSETVYVNEKEAIAKAKKMSKEYYENKKAGNEVDVVDTKTVKDAVEQVIKNKTKKGKVSKKTESKQTKILFKESKPTEVNTNNKANNIVVDDMDPDNIEQSEAIEKNALKKKDDDITCK